MTTIIPFTPVSTGRIPFEFEPVLDGQSHAGMVTWNVAGQRWFLTLTGPRGGMIFHQALSGSPVGVAIQNLVWANGFVLGTTVVPHPYKIGETIELVIRDCVPEGFNGRHRIMLVGRQTFEYRLADNPGLARGFGSISYDIDLLAGYGYASEMVFRDASQRFEVNP